MSTTGGVLYSCPFIPAEWIDAHGLKPMRVAPPLYSRGSLDRFAGVCPYAHAFAGYASKAQGIRAVVLTTACDQMRRCADVVEAESDVPVFLFHVPHTWREPTAARLYASELRRFGLFLVSVGGAEPSKARLVESAKVYDRDRQALREAWDAMGAKDWAEAAADFHAGGLHPRAVGPPPARKGPALALLGGPLPRERFGVFDEVERAGAHVALDGTETGERTLAAPIKRLLLAEDPLAALTEAYFGTIPDPFKRPNGAFFQWIRSEVDRRRLEGVIVRRYLWCDLWHAEVRRLADELPVPVLDLDVADEDGDRERNLTRLAAFVEGLQ